MRTIEIDDEVFAYLQRKAIPYVETPNLTLRRLFNLNGRKPPENILNDQPLQTKQKKRKKPKANLSTLVKNGLLNEGQTLFLYDYHGNKIDGYEATVSGKQLSRGGKTLSMSDLAKICLQEIGYKSDSVRGPAHWNNSDGISVLELWRQYLERSLTNDSD